MKKILGLTIAAMLVIAMVAGGTWAYFSDTETSSNNVFTAGTLDLGLSNIDEMATGNTTATFTASNWKPGEVADGVLYISNSGSMDMATLKIEFSYTSVDTSGRPTTISLNDPLQDTDHFDKMIRITSASWKGYDLDEYLTDVLVGKTLEEINGVEISLSDVESLTAMEKGALAIGFAFDSTATNGCQGNTLTMTISVIGTQD